MLESGKHHSYNLQINNFCLSKPKTWTMDMNQLFSRYWSAGKKGQLTPWIVDYQAPPSMEFSRQEYWSGLPFPSPHLNHFKCAVQ